MVYTATHLYVTAKWVIPGVADEGGQFGLRFLPGVVPNQTARTAVVDAIKVFWNNTTTGAPSGYSLSEVKFALVGPDGKYPADHEPSIEFVTPNDAGGGGTSFLPLQCAWVATLLTNKPRGRASKGRIYLPPLAGGVSGSTFDIGATSRDARTTAVATMINAMEQAMGNNVYVMSSIGAGTSEIVSSVTVGSRLDIQRRRARQQAEVYSTPQGV